MPNAGVQLINLEDQGAFTFQYFPESLSTMESANWEPQETTVGVKPLFYANREPRQIEFPELWFDNTETNQSLTPTIKELRKLFEETQNGTPPALLAVWGDRNERCVLVNLTIEENFFTSDGFPIRARVSLSLLQLQPQLNEATGVQITK